ncbi:ArsR/SmtB family transcription factor [Algicella marina]|uniref:Helix-turn-helix domain-containing protein n=1 Tax=Algicella marina TaxID=2683284 RepID=A0A6P1SXU8_9RHOB|nr:helix-turn-helix domain-containing protein [Algicella marina]QHQ35504.1 helix-turn-helix domain-containing protein [Algicella marina]
METKTHLPLDIEEAARAFAALGSGQRLAVLQALVAAGPEGLAAGDLAQRTGIGGSTLTHHLRFLTQSQLATQRREGRSIISTAAFGRVETLSNYLLLNCCAEPAGCVHKEHRNG